MSSITATADQTYGAVKIFLDFTASSVTGVAGAYGPVTLYRVTSDGQQIMVRNSPVWTSAGQAVFWDDEAPLQTPVSYIGSIAGGAQVVADAFGRTASSSWGNADSGQTWTTNGGVAGDYNVAGGVGTISASATNVSRRTILAAVSLTDLEATYVTSIPAVALTQPVDVVTMMRFVDASNQYFAGVRFGTGGTLSAYIGSAVAASITNISIVPITSTYGAGTQVSVKARIVGGVISVKVWLTGTAEPQAWTTSATVTNFSGPGAVGFRYIIITGNTNTLPFVASIDNYNVVNLATVTLSTGTVTITGTGLAAGQTDIGWLKDPRQPNLDVPLNFYLNQDSECTTGTGIALTDFYTVEYLDNDTEYEIINVATPTVTELVRASGSMSLLFTSLKLSDIALLRRIFATGRVLLLQAPVSYGWGPDYYGNEYIHVKKVTMDRPALQDYRHQQRLWTIEARIVSVPADTADGLVGSNGIGVGRSTWGVMKASGLTWGQLKATNQTWAGLALGQGY